MRPSSHAPTRRGFLAASASVLAAPMIVPSRVLGRTGTAPSSRITMGFIGIGIQGEMHVRHLSRYEDVQILAVCDVYEKFREVGRGIVNEAYAARSASGAPAAGCEAYLDFRELLAREDIDAVLIATPDHWHAIPVIQAARAGKHIYCEKPLSLTIDEAKRMVQAVRRHDVVFQTGSQQRSEGNFRYACELVRNGYIGQLKQVYANIGGPSGPCDLPEEPVPDGLDWDFWIGPAPWRPFSAILRPPHNNTYPAWRNYQDFSGGAMTDWGAHHFDIAQWGIGADGWGPVEITPPSGESHPRLTYRYADGVELIHGGRERSRGALFIGTEGWIEVDRGHLRSEPEHLIRTPIKTTDIHLYQSPGHHRDWLTAIRERRRPICDVEVGASTIIVCHLGNIAYWLGRPIRWDPAAQTILGDEEAARMMARASRAPWRV